MMFPGADPYAEYGDDGEDTQASAGAGGGAGAGSYRSSVGGSLDGAFSDGWASSIFASGMADGVCLLSVLMLVLVFLAGLLWVVVSALLSTVNVDPGDAGALVVLVAMAALVWCACSQLMDEGDEWRGDGLYSYASSWSAPSNQQGKPLEPGATGLHNLGNTCYMNSTLQCLSHLPALTRFYTSGDYERDLNAENALGTKGELTKEYAKLMHELWGDEFTVVAPADFKAAVAKFAPQFKGYMQHDSQELLAFVLDALHEDVNQGARTHGARGDGRLAVQAQAMVSTLEARGRKAAVALEGAKAWLSHVQRNESLVSRLFQGQLTNRLICPSRDCGHVATSFDTFMFLPLQPPPEYRMFKVELVRREPRTGRYECVEYNFRLPKVGRVAHLVTSLRAAAGISKDTRVQVATVYGGKFNKLRGSTSLLQMCRSHLFAFCLPNGTVGTLPIYHRRITRTVYPPLNEGEEPRVHLYAQTTGLPFLLPVTQDTTVHHVHAAALAWAAACHDGVFSELGYTPLVCSTDAYASACSNRHTGCRGCALDPSPTPMVVPPETAEDRPTLLFPAVCIDWGCSPTDVDGEATPTYSTKDKLYPELVEGKVEEYKSDEAAFDGAMEEDGVRLAACLDKFNRAETLGERNLWNCPACKQSVAARKQMALWRVPDVVVILLKRFAQTGQHVNKVETLVRFPLRGLDLTRWLEGPRTGESLVYDLFAVSNHSGSLEGGHYTACALSPSGVWRSYNDRHVSVVAGSAGAQTPEAIRAALHTRGAYVLMYQRRGSQGAPATPKRSLRAAAMAGSGVGVAAGGGGRSIADGASVGGRTAVTGASSVTYAGDHGGGAGAGGGVASGASSGADDDGNDAGADLSDSSSEASDDGDDAGTQASATAAAVTRRRSVTTPPPLLPGDGPSARGAAPSGVVALASGLRRRA